MRKYAIGIVAAAAVMLSAEIAAATCSASQITGAWTLVGHLGTGGSMSTFRCPALAVVSGTLNHYRLSGNCAGFEGGSTQVNWTAGGAANIVVNPTNCNGAGNFTLQSGPTTFGATNILLLKLVDPGAGTARQGQAVTQVKTATQTYSLDFTLMR